MSPDDLIPEEELRAFLKTEAPPEEDAAFEAAVLGRIRRAERRAMLLPAAVLLTALALSSVAVLPALGLILAQCATLLGSIAFVADALRPIGDLLLALVRCARSLDAAAFIEMRPFIFTVVGLALMAASARFIARRLPSRSNLHLA